MAKKVKISDLVLRDAHQSLHATRMTTADMLPALERLDNIGYESLEAWGGATFDSCIRFLNEDPWERLRTLKAKLPKTPIMMLLRGQNLLGYRHYADDVVDKFVEKAAENGIGVFRIAAAERIFHGKDDLAGDRGIGPARGGKTFFKPQPQFFRIKKRGSPVCVKDIDCAAACFDHIEPLPGLR